jgi:hypothetical protein
MIVAKKKVVRVQSDPGSRDSEPTWKPTPEAKSKATTFRLIALVLWLVAIGIEGFAIFWVLKQHSVNMVLLIGAIVAIGVLSIIGSLLWKSANRADPARKSETIRFFIQNQLGAIIAIIAFLPLIVMIFTNKNMAGQQKGIAGGIAIAVLAVAAIVGFDFNPQSVEGYETETSVVHQLTGQDLVYWTTQGSVYHLCEDASAVNRQSADDTIHEGTVKQAHAAGMKRLTLEVTEELHQCNLAVPSPLPAGLPSGAR